MPERKRIAHLITRLESRKAQIAEKVHSELRNVGVWIAPYKELDPQQQAWVREHYLRNIFPLITPQAMDPARQALGVACRIGPGRRCIGRHWREESPCSWRPSPVRRGKPECRSKRDGRHVAQACHPSGRCP